MARGSSSCGSSAYSCPSMPSSGDSAGTAASSLISASWGWPLWRRTRSSGWIPKTWNHVSTFSTCQTSGWACLPSRSRFR
eukprot:7805990-Pyramimonas_sp.AAC.1